MLLYIYSLVYLFIYLFIYVCVCVPLSLLVAPVFPQLYFHMLRQRKKVLGHVEEYSKVE